MAYKYLGPGVLRVGKKEFASGCSFDEKLIDKDDLKALEAEGLVQSPEAEKKASEAAQKKADDKAKAKNKGKK